MDKQALKEQLEEWVRQFNRPVFIEEDPICIPHLFDKKQDIEIAGFWVAMLAWGRRQTIIQKARELMELMDFSPHDFILHHQEADRKAFLSFKHRTFQPLDTLYFLEFLQFHYRRHDSLECAFLPSEATDTNHVGPHLRHFHRYFFSLPEAPDRTRKHVATPDRKSSCKRLNMFLRWMVRQDEAGVDFGLWKSITPPQLLPPLDVHVGRIAREMGLLRRTQSDWKAVLELSDQLRGLDPKDPVKYDFALFGLGVLGPSGFTY